LLQDTNRLAEAEPLMRRALDIVLEFERRNGYEHPHKTMFSKNYAGILRELGSLTQRLRRLWARLWGRNPMSF
jgi:hypothetical protein